MLIIKPNQTDLEILRPAALRLRTANSFFGAAKQESDAAKKTLSGWLKEHRKIDVETLAIGEFVSIEGVLLIEIAKQNKFDESGLLSADPKTHALYKKDFPVRKFKPLV